jgi:hypothetical protein
MMKTDHRRARPLTPMSDRETHTRCDMTRQIHAAHAGRISALLAILTASGAAPAWGAFGARPVALLPPSGDNVAVSILDSSREILKDHLQRTGAYTVLEPEAGASRTEATAVHAAEQARAVGAEQAIVVRITHVGSSARVRLTAYWAHTAQVAYWDSIVVTGGPDELDVALERLTHAMHVGRPVRDSAELETVTVKEGQALNRRNASRSFGVHIFTLLPFNAAGGSSNVMPAGGLYWLYDARSWMADIAFDIGGQGDRAYYGMAIGGYYPLSREDFTPYIGAMLRWAYMNLGGHGSSGIVVQPTAGVLLGRLSSTQLRAEVGYFVNSFAEAEVSANVAPVGQVAPASQGGRAFVSHGFVLSVGIGF